MNRLSNPVGRFGPPVPFVAVAGELYVWADAVGVPPALLAVTGVPVHVFHAECGQDRPWVAVEDALAFHLAADAEGANLPMRNTIIAALQKAMGLHKERASG